MEEPKLTKSAKAFNYKNVRADQMALSEFEHAFHIWVHSSVQEIKGLPRKKYIVSGVTDAFNQLYSLYNKIGIFNGEYGYHKRVLGDRVTEDFREADYGVPIFVDCALFGVCKGIDFDFKRYKNVRSVCFSLSKTFGTGLRRVGLLYTKDDFAVTKYAGWQYPLVSSAEHHYKLLQTVGPDDMPNMYAQKQLRICRKLELMPSSTVIFGLDYTDRWSEFKRGDVNRVCITDELESK